MWSPAAPSRVLKAQHSTGILLLHMCCLYHGSWTFHYGSYTFWWDHFSQDIWELSYSIMNLTWKYIQKCFWCTFYYSLYTWKIWATGLPFVIQSFDVICHSKLWITVILQPCRSVFTDSFNEYEQIYYINTGFFEQVPPTIISQLLLSQYPFTVCLYILSIKEHEHMYLVFFSQLNNNLILQKELSIWFTVAFFILWHHLFLLLKH